MKWALHEREKAGDHAWTGDQGSSTLCCRPEVRVGAPWSLHRLLWTCTPWTCLQICTYSQEYKAFLLSQQHCATVQRTSNSQHDVIAEVSIGALKIRTKFQTRRLNFATAMVCCCEAKIRQPGEQHAVETPIHCRTAIMVATVYSNLLMHPVGGGDKCKRPYHSFKTHLCGAVLITAESRVECRAAPHHRAPWTSKHAPNDVPNATWSGMRGQRPVRTHVLCQHGGRR